MRTHRATEVVLEPAGPTGEGLTAWADGEPVGPLPGALVVVGAGRRPAPR